MGFFGNLWNKVKTGAQKVGSFVENKVKPIVGKVADGVKKVSHFINNNPIANAVGDVLENVPIVGRGVHALREASKYAERGADIVNNGLDVSNQISNAIKNPNIDNAKAIYESGKNIYNQGKELRDDIKKGQLTNSNPLRGPPMTTRPIKTRQAMA